MSKILKLRGVNVFLAIINALFFYYYFRLAFYSRLYFDDYNFLRMIREEGIFNFLFDIYNFHSGRFVYYFVDAIVNSVVNKTGAYFYWSLIFLVFGVTSLYFLLKKSVKQFSGWMCFNIAALVFNVFIITSYETVVFFQLCAMVYYAMPVFLLMALYVINLRKVSALNYVILLVLGVILGGVHEAFTPCCLLLLAINAFCYFKISGYSLKNTLSNSHVRYLIFIMAIMVVAFLIVMAAPGNYSNLAGNHEYQKAAGITDLLVRSLKIYVMYLYFFIFRIPYYLFMFVVFAYLGLTFKGQVVFKDNYFKTIIFFIPVYLIYVWLITLVNAYMMPRFGIYRIYTHANFLTVAAVCVYSFLFGLERLNAALPRLRWVLFIALGLMAVCQALNIYYDIPAAKQYAESDEKRIEYLLQLKEAGNKKLISVEPLKTPSTFTTKYIALKMLKKQQNFVPLLYGSAELETSETGRNNKALVNYYDLGFPIVRKDN